MALPWVRLDANIAAHDKILGLLSDEAEDRWQAAASYMFAMAWSGGAGTDGFVRRAALPFVHGTAATAKLLVAYELWDEMPDGYHIRNYAARQELEVVSQAKRAAQRAGALKANCQRFHGKDCGCWRDKLEAV